MSHPDVYLLDWWLPALWFVNYHPDSPENHEVLNDHQYLINNSTYQPNSVKMAVVWVVPCRSLLMFKGDCSGDEGSKQLWNVHKFLPDYMVQQPIWQPLSHMLPWESQISISACLWIKNINTINYSCPQLIQLVAQEKFIEFSCHESFKSYIISTVLLEVKLTNAILF
jgi:hypothetical protein